MYEYESWTIKKAECQRINTFKLCCWRRLLRVPWIARRSNQSILKEASPEYSLEGLMLKWNSNTLATWWEELTHWKRPWCWERLKVGGEGNDRGWDGWMASSTQWTWVWVNSGSWWWTGRPAAAAADKSLQSCPTLCDPIDGSPPGSFVPGILQARTLEWVAISFSNAWKWKVKVKSLRHVQMFTTPWPAAYQAPPSMGFPRQEYWRGVPLPSPQEGLACCSSWGRKESNTTEQLKRTDI